MSNWGKSGDEEEEEVEEEDENAFKVRLRESFEMPFLH